MGQLIIISGPSCAGKTPLFRSYAGAYPKEARRLRKLVLYNSRLPRPGEKEGIDYFFRPRREVSSLAKRPGFIVMNVRGDIQALDTVQLKKDLLVSDVIFEGNPFIGGRLLSLRMPGVKKLGVFVSPLSREEILSLKRLHGRSALGDLISAMMKKRLLRRASLQGRKLNAYALRDITRRAESALREMKEARRYDFVLPNHDGEDSDNWTAFKRPVGDAGKTLSSFASILRGRKTGSSEKWSKSLL